MLATNTVIDPSAKIASDVSIGPYTVIGPEVEIGSGTVIESHVVIKGPTKIGRNNHVYQFASIGEACQDKKYAGEHAVLEIGDHNIFREFCTIHRGTLQGGGLTKIGNHNIFMVSSHVAHDCIVGNHVIFSNNSAIAGHVTVDDYAILSGFVGVHQFCSIGAYSFSAGGTMITKDVMPFCKVSGYPAKSYGLNFVGLERNGFSVEQINYLKAAYKIITNDSSTVSAAIESLERLVLACPWVQKFIDFLKHSSRGVVR